MYDSSTAYVQQMLMRHELYIFSVSEDAYLCNRLKCSNGAIGKSTTRSVPPPAEQRFDCAAYLLRALLATSAAMQQSSSIMWFSRRCSFSQLQASICPRRETDISSGSTNHRPEAHPNVEDKAHRWAQRRRDDGCPSEKHRG